SYVLSSQGVARATRYRRRTVPWEKIRTLWLLKNSLILFYSDTGYWVLPFAQIPDQARAYLMKKIHEIGVRTKSLG
ncbi:MAG: hypothetical protein ACKVHP_06330, partial [Verrucomicrobiales bacterium]